MEWWWGGHVSGETIKSMEEAFGSLRPGFFFFSASPNNSRPGGGTGSVEPSRSPGDAGHVGDVGGSEVSVSCSREYTGL